jgi:hypothetical protein
MKTRILILAVLLLAGMNTAFAQPGQTTLTGAYVPSPPDQTYTKELNAQRRVKAWPYLRESDVLWKKRVWEQIDIRQKINYPLFYPIEEKVGRKSLWHIILHGLNDGDITAYRAFGGPYGFADDEFTEPVATNQVSTVIAEPFDPSVLASMPYLTEPDQDLDRFADTNDGCPGIPGPANADPKKNGCPKEYDGIVIVGYQLKEDWIFDKQRSQRFVRIIGIAPLIEDANKKWVPLFWLYYPECRGLFALSECFNTQNDAFKGTFEDLFETRHFSAYVTKEENVYDRKLEQYVQGVDALLEGERIKKEIFEYEHDLWNY